jgi:hypothetical protein
MEMDLSDPQAPKVWPRIGRRAALTKIVKVAGLAIATPAAVEALASPARAQAPIASKSVNVQLVRATKPGPRFGPDGLMSRYVEGPLAAKLSSSMVLSSPKPGVGSVKVVVTKSSLIRAGGQDVHGDLSQIALGDNMVVATYLPARGDRIVLWAVANAITGRGVVTSSESSAVVVTAIGRWRTVAKGNAMTLKVGPATKVHTPTLTTVGSAASLSPGDPVYFTGHTSQQGTGWPGQLWAASIFQMESSPQEWDEPRHQQAG